MKLITRPRLTISITQKDFRGNCQLSNEMHPDKTPLTYGEVTFNNAKAGVFQEEHC